MMRVVIFWPRDTKADMMTVTVTLPKSSFGAGVCHTPPHLLDNLPPLGRPFCQNHQPQTQVDDFDNMVAPMGEIVQQMGRSVAYAWFALWRAKKSHFQPSDEMRMKTSIRF
jgi:hypothetical protein